MPFPPDYGGVIGIFNRIRALHESGLEIHLHVFYHDRQPKKELEQFCHKVYYYKRDMRKSLLFSRIPFIVVSRSSRKLLQNLTAVDAPILFEGIHTCFYLNHPDIDNRIRLVRMHNVEHDYYFHLSLAEPRFFKKWYLKQESKKLLAYEDKLKNCSRILAVVESDQEYFMKKFGHSELMPVFIDSNRFAFNPEQNSSVLYHGNLAISENEKAADWLIREVFSKINHICIIAGREPSMALQKAASKYPNIKIIRNPPKEEMDRLVQTSAVIALPTFQATGIKLKLIDSLMQGKHCIVNAEMLTGTSLQPYCSMASSPDEWIQLINSKITALFTLEDFEKRKAHLSDYFNNNRSVERIKQLIKGEVG